ncbi:MAG: DUF374 domain-containing protein [Acidobacteria bacterium]|nr:DUF374 domain-containing protein [Acidobacteriota bacterium]
MSMPKDKSGLSTQHSALSSSNPQDSVLDAEPTRGLAYWDTPRTFTFWQRIQIAVLSRVAVLIISSIGRTLRWESEGDEHLERVYKEGKRAILVCWHCCTFASTYYWRRQGIVVMSSQNFDGECLAGGLRKLGYGLARGSSSRGGLKALAEMARWLRSGKDAGFTVDGPRGPRFEVKPGPMLLARRTGAAVLCFHVSLQRKIQLSTWDHTQIPIPFSKALMLKAPPIFLERDANEDELKNKIAELQRTLDELREKAEGHWE